MNGQVNRKKIIEQVIAMWSDHPSSVIAERLGITRSAVIGIIHRARQKGQAIRGKKQEVMIPASSIMPVPAISHHKKHGYAPRIAALPPPMSVEKSTPPRRGYADLTPDSRPANLIDAPLFTCRVVVGASSSGEALYCCAPVFRYRDGRPSRISCCGPHRPRMFSSAVSIGKIEAISTDFKRERRVASHTSLLETDHG